MVQIQVNGCRLKNLFFGQETKKFHIMVGTILPILHKDLRHALCPKTRQALSGPLRPKTHLILSVQAGL